MAHTIKKDGINYNLTDLEKYCWESIINGALRSNDKFHNATVANFDADIINMRTVVVRAADVANKTITFHTDTRSCKWTNLKKNNTVSWLFYDAPRCVQIRAAGYISLHDKDEIADWAWLKTPIPSRKNYLSENPPSTTSEIPTSGLRMAFENNEPTLEESEEGRKNFGVIVTKVNWMEWLSLSKNGHARASFNYKSDETFIGKWLIP